MKTLVLIVAAVIATAALLMLAYAGQRAREQRRAHDAIEYYGGWTGYSLPIRLIEPITKQEAEARGARGAVYMIGHFDSDGRLVRDVKMLGREVFFSHDYSYFPSGSLRRVRVVNGDGVESVQEYEDRGRWWSFW